ncbi:hypothetical protein AAG587_17510 [Vreelandella neptunia]|uniref:hypothetical protein n=1 Tax=Vreelandella neptunia TaxID=115551 RepID=UPI003159AAA9
MMKTESDNLGLIHTLAAFFNLDAHQWTVSITGRKVEEPLSNKLSATMAKCPPTRSLSLAHALPWLRIGMAALMLLGLFLVATHSNAHHETDFLQGSTQIEQPPGILPAAITAMVATILSVPCRT